MCQQWEHAVPATLGILQSRPDHFCQGTPSCTSRYEKGPSHTHPPTTPHLTHFIHF